MGAFLVWRWQPKCRDGARRSRHARRAATKTTKTPAMGPRFLFNVGGDRLRGGGMLAIQSMEETAFEDFWFPRPLIKIQLD